MRRQSITENGDLISANFIGKVAGAVADMNQVREGVGRMLFAGEAGEESIGEGTAKIAGDSAIGEEDFDFPTQAIARAKFWDRVYLENLNRTIPAVLQENIDAVLAAEVPVAIGKRKADFDRIQGNAPSATLFDGILADTFVFNCGFNRKFGDAGAGCCQDCACQGQG